MLGGALHPGSQVVQLEDTLFRLPEGTHCVGSKHHECFNKLQRRVAFHDSVRYECLLQMMIEALCARGVVIKESDVGDQPLKCSYTLCQLLTWRLSTAWRSIGRLKLRSNDRSHGTLDQGEDSSEMEQGLRNAADRRSADV